MKNIYAVYMDGNLKSLFLNAEQAKQYACWLNYNNGQQLQIVVWEMLLKPSVNDVCVFEANMGTKV